MSSHSMTAIAALSIVGSASAGVFVNGNLLVQRIGDGTTTLGSAAAAVSVLEYSRSGGSAVQTITFPTTGSNQVTDTGSATSNGYLNVYNGYVGVSGYNSGAGGTPPSPFAGSNFRSMIATGANTFYATGNATGSPSTGGAWYYDGSTFTQVSSTTTGQPTNLRNVEIYNNQLYVSSSTGSFIGISSIGSGLPTASGQAASLQINVGAGASPYGFVMFDTNSDSVLDLAYIADDRTTAGGGLQKWTLSGGTWSSSWALLVNGTGTLQATAGSGFAGLRGLTGTWDAVNGAQLFATTTETTNNRLISIIDNGITPTSASNLASAGANYVFRGVDVYNTIPAPGALALLGVAGMIGARRRR